MENTWPIIRGMILSHTACTSETGTLESSLGGRLEEKTSAS